MTESDSIVEPVSIANMATVTNMAKVYDRWQRLVGHTREHLAAIVYNLENELAQTRAQRDLYQKQLKHLEQKTMNKIIISRSETADTRTCDYANVTQKTLLNSSVQHISDVRRGLAFFQAMLAEAATRHDEDKITDIEGFHRDFVSGFVQTDWWDRHRTINRHHLLQDDGIPSDVNLIDVLDMITDCVMAGMARSGTVYPLAISPKVLYDAFVNTVKLLQEHVEVDHG